MKKLYENEVEKETVVSQASQTIVSLFKNIFFMFFSFKFTLKSSVNIKKYLYYFLV